ncbi:MAG: N-acetyltransferase family protein [Rhodospirillales bacterium]|nr:MAG: N-acetyltransferase family protein [Rhodospirillales bacterium]
MTKIHLRPATIDDMARVQAIYAHHVRNGTGSFEIEPPDLDEMKRRFGEVRMRNLPFLVAEIEGAIAGYAYANLYRPRAAYRFTCEDSVYIDPSFHQRGLGHALLDALIAGCGQAGFKQMVAVIGGSDNKGSIRLHEKHGFVRVGLLPKVGFKFDRWLDSVLMQRELG